MKAAKSFTLRGFRAVRIHDETISISASPAERVIDRGCHNKHADHDAGDL